MNEMRKLMESIKLIEDFDDEEHYSMKYADVEKFQGRKIIITDLYDGDVYGILDTKHGPRFMLSAPLWRGDVGPGEVDLDEIDVSSPSFDINRDDEAFLKEWYLESLESELDEANQGGKTEHSGAKKGKGAFYGRKKEAKRDSNKNRRQADKAASVEETIEIIGEGEQFKSSGHMLMTMLRRLKGITNDANETLAELRSYGDPGNSVMYGDDVAEDAIQRFGNVTNRLGNLIKNMEDAEVNPDKAWSGRRR